MTIFILFNKLNVQKTNLIENEGFVTFKFYWTNYKYHVSKKYIFYFYPCIENSNLEISKFSMVRLLVSIVFFSILDSDI